MAIIYKDALRLFKSTIRQIRNLCNRILGEKQFTKNDIKKLAIQAFEDDFRKMILEALKDAHVTISSDE